MLGAERPTRRFFKSSHIHLIIIAVTALACYSNTFDAPFHFDDILSIVENPHIRKISNFLVGPSKELLHQEIYRALISRTVGYFTFALNYRAHGLDVTGYHVVNLAIHMMNAVLVYFIVTLTFRTPFMEGAPLGRQSGRTSLAALFYLASFVIYIKARFSARSALRHAHYAVAIVFALLAMKTKEIAATLPFAILIYELMFFKGTLKKRFFSTVSLFLLVILFSIVVVGLHGSFGETTKDIKLQTNMSRSDYLFTQFSVVVTYLRLLVLPVNQNLDYDYPVYRVFLDPHVLLSLLFLTGVFSLGIYLFYRSRVADRAMRIVSFGIVWFFVTISIESTFIPIVDVIFEHRVYLPSTGFFIAAVVSLFAASEKLKTRIPRLEKTIIATLAFIVVLMSGATYARNTVWLDEAGLWEDVVRKSPMKSRGYSNLGGIYYERGQYDKALWHFNRSIEIDNVSLDIERTYANRGLTHYMMGQHESAFEDFNKAIYLNPDFREAYYYRGDIYLMRKKFDKARDDFRKSCDMGDMNGCKKLQFLKELSWAGP
jgi:hypothetical protein